MNERMPEKERKEHSWAISKKKSYAIGAKIDTVLQLQTQIIINDGYIGAN